MVSEQIERRGIKDRAVLQAMKKVPRHLFVKEKFLNEAADNNYVLIFEHDFDVESCTVKHTDKGVRVDKSLTVKEILS